MTIVDMYFIMVLMPCISVTDLSRPLSGPWWKGARGNEEQRSRENMKYHARSMSGGIEWKRIYYNIVQYVDTSLKTTWLWKSTLKQCITTAVIDMTSVIMSAKPAWQYKKHIMKLHSKNVNQCDQCEYVPTTGSDLNNHMTCGRSMPGEVGW